MNKKLLGILLATGVIAVGCSSEQGSTGTYATVNGVEVSQKSYDDQLELYKNMIAQQYQLPQAIQNSLVQEVVMKQDLEKNGIEIIDEDYDEDYQKTVQNYGGEEAYKTYLEDNGLTDEQMKESSRYETISRMHKAWYNENNTPSDEDIQTYFDQNKDSLVTANVSHILVATEDEAKSVKERLDNGEDFAAVAKETSMDNSAANGGNLGDASPSNYVPEFRDAVLSLEPGKISDPVQTQFGYHIIRVESKNDTVDSLKESIVEALNQTSYNDYVTQLVSTADVKLTNDTSNSVVEEVSGSDESSESVEESSSN